MRKGLMLLAGILVTMSFAAQPSVSLTFPICSATVCNGNDQPCRCPSGTPAAGQLRFCATWYGDCHYW